MAFPEGTHSVRENRNWTERGHHLCPEEEEVDTHMPESEWDKGQLTLDQKQKKTCFGVTCLFDESDDSVVVLLVKLYCAGQPTDGTRELNYTQRV